MGAELDVKGDILAGRAWVGAGKDGGEPTAPIYCCTVGKEAAECALGKQESMLLERSLRSPALGLLAWCWGPVLLLCFPSRVRQVCS